MDVLGSEFRHGDSSFLLLCSIDGSGGMNQMYTNWGACARRPRSGADLELDGGAVGREDLRDPEVGADRRARILDRLDLGCAARAAAGKVDHLREVASLRAVDGDAIAHGCRRRIHRGATYSVRLRRRAEITPNRIAISGCAAARAFLRSASPVGARAKPAGSE